MSMYSSIRLFGIDPSPDIGDSSHFQNHVKKAARSMFRSFSASSRLPESVEALALASLLTRGAVRGACQPPPSLCLRQLTR